MGTNVSRRVGRVLAAGALLASFGAAPAAWAAPSQHIVNTIKDLSCVFETVESDLVYFGASAMSSTGESGSFMFVETVDYDLVLQSSDPGTAGFGEDGSFLAEIDLLSADTGEFVGTATVEGVRTAMGEPMTSQVRERSGNQWTAKGTVTTTDYDMDVTSVTVPGYEVQIGADDCVSQDLAFDVRTTNPEGHVYRDSGFDTDICHLEGLDFGEVMVSGNVREPVFQVVIDDGVSPQKASGTIPLRGHSGRATANLIDLTTGEVIADVAISVDLVKTGTRQKETESIDGVTTRTARTFYTASIAVSTTDGRSVAECPAVEYSETVIIHPGSGGDGH